MAKGKKRKAEKLPFIPYFGKKASRRLELNLTTLLWGN